MEKKEQFSTVNTGILFTTFMCLEYKEVCVIDPCTGLSSPVSNSCLCIPLWLTTFAQVLT